MMSVHRASSINIGSKETVITFELGGEQVEWIFDTNRIKTYHEEYARVSALDDRLHFVKIFTVEVPRTLFDHQFNIHYGEVISPTETQLQEFLARSNTKIAL